MVYLPTCGMGYPQMSQELHIRLYDVYIQHPGPHEYMNCPSRPARGNISASNQQEEEQKPKLVRQELILAIRYYARRR